MAVKSERLECIRKAKDQANAEIDSRVSKGWDATPINAARASAHHGPAHRERRVDRQRKPDQQRSLDVQLSVFAGARLFFQLVRRLLGLGLGRRHRRQARVAQTPRRRLSRRRQHHVRPPGSVDPGEISHSSGRHRLQQPRLHGGEESIPRLRRKNQNRRRDGRGDYRAGNQLRQARGNLRHFRRTRRTSRRHRSRRSSAPWNKTARRWSTS